MPLDKVEYVTMLILAQNYESPHHFDERWIHQTQNLLRGVS